MLLLILHHYFLQTQFVNFLLTICQVVCHVASQMHIYTSNYLMSKSKHNHCISRTHIIRTYTTYINLFP